MAIHPATITRNLDGELEISCSHKRCAQINGGICMQRIVQPVRSFVHCQWCKQIKTPKDQHWYCEEKAQKALLAKLWRPAYFMTMPLSTSKS